MKKINEAHDVLTDPVRRTEYNRSLGNETGEENTYKQSNPDQCSTSGEDPSRTENSDNPAYEAGKELTTKVLHFLFYKWRAVIIGLVLAVLFESKFLFFASVGIMIAHFFLSMGNPQLKTRGFKKIAVMWLCGSLLLFSYAIVFGGEEALETNDAGGITPENHVSDVIDETEDKLPTDEATKDEQSLLVPSESTESTGSEAQNVTTTTTTKPTSSPTEKEITNPANPSFSAPAVLEKKKIDSVVGICSDLALVWETVKGESVCNCYNLNTGLQSVKADEILYSSEIDDGRLLYRDHFGKICFIDNTDSGEVKGEKGVDINHLLIEKRKYVGMRMVETPDYSGHEFALFAFDGTKEVDWIREPAKANTWINAGDGMFYAGYDVDPDDYDDYTFYFVDMLTGKTMNWPAISYGDWEYDYSYLTSGMGQGNEFYLSGHSDFKDEKCIAYLQKSDIGDSPLIFYEIDRQGKWKQISKLPTTKNLHYLEDRGEFICVSYNYDTAIPYQNLILRDMYGNVFLDLSDSLVVNYSISDEGIIIGQKNKSGSSDAVFYSIYDLEGKIKHEPFNIKEQSITLLESINCYALIGEKDLTVYNMNDQPLLNIKPIEVKEPGFLFSKKYTYYPTDIRIYNGYYVIDGVETEKGGHRDFIGKLDLK